MPTRLYHKDGTLPQKTELFVFGSNEAARHGAGAALVAAKRFGAVGTVSEGYSGRSYAIPTKSAKLKPLSFDRVRANIHRFVNYTIMNPHLTFFVTRVGCGLARFKDSEIAPLFRSAENCNFPEQWRQYLELESRG